MQKKKKKEKLNFFQVLHVFWPFGKVSCKLAGSLQGFGVFLSTFSITAIAFDRLVFCSNIFLINFFFLFLLNITQLTEKNKYLFDTI